MITVLYYLKPGIRFLSLLTFCFLFSGLVAGDAWAQAAPPGRDASIFTTGPARTVDPAFFVCRQSSGRPTARGIATSDDGRRWFVPAETRFSTAPKAADLYNACNGTLRRRLSDLDLATLPVIDAGGRETFTAYIFADNYFELYVNGRLVAVDAVPFTPFNSSVVRFRADRPFTLAILAVDWEENLGLGSERSRGVAYHPGDAGLVAVIKDARGRTVAITDGSWRAQVYYIAPLADRACLKLRGTVRDSSACPTRSVRNGRSFHAAHWPLPANWFAPGFDDSGWPLARVYTNETVGVRNKPAYTNFTDLFDDPKADARFIWTSNLVLDNLVLMRKRVD